MEPAGLSRAAYGRARAPVGAVVCVIACAWLPGHAEQLSAFGGVTDTDDHSSGSYAWGLQYRQRLSAHLDAGFGYFNEGHLLGHHRDGALLQLWARTAAWHDRVEFAFGAGPYAYCDTQNSPDPSGFADRHGVGALFTGSVSYALADNWVALLELRQVVASGNVATRTALVGLGYRLDSVLQRLGQSHDADTESADLLNEFGVFGGFTVINTLSSERSGNFGIEFRRRAARHLELSAGLLSEGDGADGRHTGATAEAWAVQDFGAQQLVLGLGAGPYVAIDGYRTVDGRGAASVVGLVSMTVGWRPVRALTLRLSWHRAFTSDDQDRDIVTAGVGWRF